MRAPLDVLRAIEREDPDGGPTEPTDADYDAHERWAVATYGPDAWADYSRGGWEPTPEV